MALEQVEEVQIEAEGVFKYILIELTQREKKGKEPREEKSRTIVRGFEWAEFHADILDRVSPKFHQLGLEYECVGGGRIHHDSKSQKIHIYGYSVSFGQADHKLTQQLLCKKFKYPEGNVTWSNAGY